MIDWAGCWLLCAPNPFTMCYRTHPSGTNTTNIQIQIEQQHSNKHVRVVGAWLSGRITGLVSEGTVKVQSSGFW